MPNDAKKGNPLWPKEQNFSKITFPFKVFLYNQQGVIFVDSIIVLLCFNTILWIEKTSDYILLTTYFTE